MPSVRDVATMPKSKTKLKSTKAGVALSAEALAKLQRLAEWMEGELSGNQDPQVRLSYLGRVTVTTNDETGNVTFASPFGVLVQMHKPFKLTDCYQLRYNMYSVTSCQMRKRVMEVLDVNEAGYFKLLQYVFFRPQLTDVIEALRDLP